MRHIVNFSAGLSSWAAARRVADFYGTDNLTLLFADTRKEWSDAYRFLRDAARNIGVPVTRIADGRTPWQVFRDERYIGNSRVDPCSKKLKRKLLDSWHRENCDPKDTVIHVGLRWDEMNRFERFRDAIAPWIVDAPLMWKPFIYPSDLAKMARDVGLEPSDTYAAGFPHDNCSGACVKAGQAQWRLLLRVRPEVFAENEQEEESMREYLGKDVSILSETVNGEKRALPLKLFRERIESGCQIDAFDWGGCGCAL